MVVPDWFTPPRLRRIESLLEVLPSRLEPVPLESATSRVWPAVGGPVDEVGTLIEAATAVGLVDVIDGAVGRMPLGTRVRNQNREGNRGALALQVLRSGVMAPQARLLVENAIFDEHENCFRCPRSVRRPAAQLIELLRLEEDIVVPEGLRLSRRLYELIGAVWVFMEPAEHLPPWLRQRQLVGHLAELFSWNRERLLANDPSKVGWVSQDDDSLGYDIEDRNAPQARCIEVKGSQGAGLSFVLTSNEMEKAERLGPNYEIHFWGKIDPTRDPQQLYDSLTAIGYPTIIVDPAAVFARGGWDIRIAEYRITRL